MRELLVIVLLSTVAVQIQSKSFYRNGRDLKINEVPPEQLRQIPVVIIQEEILVPVESLQNIVPVAAVEEPSPVLIENNVRRKDEIIVETDALGEQEEHFPVVASDEVPEASPENLLVPAETIEESPVQPILKQDGSSTSRPSIIEQAQQIINNNPFTQFVDSIRRPSTKAPETVGAEATTNANILQQLQAGVQSIGSQIQSAFTPGQSTLQAAASNPTETVVRPPNFLEQLQTNFQNTVQGIFRPNTDQSGGNQPQGPFQAVLSNVQNFLAGNRVDASSTQSAAADSQQLPVDNKVDPIVAQASEQVVVAVAPEHPVEAVSNAAENDAVVLVGSDSSLENESQ